MNSGQLPMRHIVATLSDGNTIHAIGRATSIIARSLEDALPGVYPLRVEYAAVLKAEADHPSNGKDPA